MTVGRHFLQIPGPSNVPGNVDRVGHARPRRLQCDRRGRPSCAAGGRYDLVAGLGGLPPRRMGRGRYRVGLAKGSDAAAGPFLQCRQRKGHEGVRKRGVQAVVLELAGDVGAKRYRIFPVYAGDEHALRSERSDRHASRGRPGQRLCTPRTSRGATRAAVEAWVLEVLCKMLEHRSTARALPRDVKTGSDRTEEGGRSMSGGANVQGSTQTRWIG